MAYNPKMYQAIGRLVSGAGKEHLDTLFSQYLTMLMQTLSKPTNRRKHTNVLMHLQGFFKKYLDPQEKQELAEQIDKYRLGYVPLLAPITLLQHHLRKYPNDYLSNQVYLAPYPEQLGLRA
ncbi:YbgA family protein [Aestuariibacter halophilus]|uniref:YbgA family protein n=2 Tax=Fluctibacter halophilus TaxID=226011 RepID=A0ABS8G4Z8_9ALTE|nr:YbgA family protein [Aestuariibacter halophilus]